MLSSVSLLCNSSRMIVVNTELKSKDRNLGYVEVLKDNVKSQVHWVIHQPVAPVCELLGVQ